MTVQIQKHVSLNPWHLEGSCSTVQISLCDSCQSHGDLLRSRWSAAAIGISIMGV
ncbi:hypothetical protein M404DRAFT_994201, partial [Pisolithus tinctorius Marx 270]